MMSKKPHKSDAFEAIHNSATALHRSGVIDKATMRDFDETCLSTTPAFAPEDIQRLREANHVSQPVFARYLNTSGSTVEKWETGASVSLTLARQNLGIAPREFRART